MSKIGSIAPSRIAPSQPAPPRCYQFDHFIHSDDVPIPKGSTVIYRAYRAPLSGAVSLKWQVTNTGAEAMRVCPRGGFERPNEGKSARLETTAYTGKHFVQFFAIKGGACVQHSKPFFINVK